MGGEEKYSITNAKIVANNFKTKEGHRSYTARFGMNTFGKDKP